MSNYVPGCGSSSAKLAIVGEAPGAEEDRLMTPFVGPTGRIVDKLLEECGTSREAVYLTNVIKHRPPNNDPKRIHELGKSLNDYMPQLKEELTVLKPNAILALGNTALEALTGYRGIEKYRGSILQSNLSIKVVPSLHPASLLHSEGDSKLRNWKDLTFIRWDFERAIKQSTSSTYEIPRRNLIICRNAFHLYNFLERNKDKRFVAVDIETFKTIPVCISFAFSSSEAISVPFFNNLSNLNPTGITRSDQLSIWKMVSDLMYNVDIFKIGQNFKFDEGQLAQCYDGRLNFGIKTRGFFFDTMLGFRTLYPELPSGLAFQTSVLTEEPYYKDEGKEYNPKKDKLDRLLLYNAKDAVVTFECFEQEIKELEERGLTKFFFERVMPLHPLYQSIENRGILRDDFQQKFLLEKYNLKLEELQTELNELLGARINVNSPKQVNQLLYNVLNIPQRKGTDEKTLDALLRNTIKDQTKKRIVNLILQIRKVGKAIGTYIEAAPDHDGRLRTSYKIMLETGRTSTKSLKPPVRTASAGLAFQTITKHGEEGSDIRQQFVPDKGYVFIEADLSQAEARVVALLANDSRMLKMFEYGVDIHRVTAGWIFGRSPDHLLYQFFIADPEESTKLKNEINKILKQCISDSERQLGKKFRHAGNYDMGKRTAAENAEISEWKAAKILDKFHETNPQIRGTFHKEIVEALRHNGRTLVNPFLRERQFLNRWGDDLFKEGYAQIPQSTVSDQLKFAMLKISRRVKGLEILQESHDSFLAQVPISQVDPVVRIIKEELECPIDFSKCTLKRGLLTIPCDISIGKTSWHDMQKIQL